MSTWLSATAVLAQLKDEWGLSSGQGAWLTIAVQLGFVVGALLSSIVNLPDVLPPRRIIAAAALGAAVVNALLVTVDTAGAAVVLRAMTGFFVAGIYPPALKFISTWFKTGRGVALGVLVGALTLGTASPHLVNAFGGVEWQAVVLVASVLSLLGAIVVSSVKEGPYPFPRAIFDPRQIGRTVANRGVRLASLGYFGHMWELYAAWVWVHVFFTHLASDNPRSGAATAFAVIGVGALGCYLGGRLGDRWGRTRTTALAMGVSGLCALTIGFVESLPVAVAIGIVWGFAVIADSAQFSTMVTELADQAYVGTALTLQLALGFTLTVVTIWLIPVLERSQGWGWAFALLVPGPVLGVVAMMRLKSLPEAAQLAGGRG